MVRGGIKHCHKAAHAQEVRRNDVEYAQRQIERHRNWRRTNVCVVDPEKRCTRAWRCGFESKVDGCRSFVLKTRVSSKCNGVPKHCGHCSRENMLNCGWVCVMEAKPREEQA